MTRSIRSLVVTLAATAPIGTVTLGTVVRADDGPATVELTPGLSHAAFTAEFEQRTKAGFRPLRVSTAAVDRQYVFSVSWEKRPQPQFFMQPGLTTSEFEAKHAELGEQGFLLVGFGSVYGDELTHQGVWERKEGPDLQLRLGLSATELSKAQTELSGQGLRLRSLGVAAGTKGVLYSGVWEASDPAAPARELDLNVPFARVRALITRRTRMGFRCLEVFGSEVEGNERYAFLWEKGEGSPQRIQVRLSDESLAAERKEWEEGRGHRLGAVNVYSLRKAARYAVVWDGPPRAE